MKIFKLFIIALMLVGVMGLGFLLGPEQKTAEAKVFDNFFDLTKRMPTYLFDSHNSGEPRRVMMNNNTTWLQVSKSKDNISSVLKFYYEKYPAQKYLKLPTEYIDKSNSEELKEDLIRFNALIDRFSSNSNFIEYHDTYGFFSAIEYRTGFMEVGSPKWFDEFKKKLENGKFGSFATGRVVIALRSEGSSETTILNIWTDRDFDFNNLTPDQYGDMPGFDIENVPRFPSTRRLVSVEQENLHGVYRLVQYEGEGSVASNVLFYHSRMEQEGWFADPTFEQISRDYSIENTLFYVQDDRECTIHIERDQGNGQIMTTVIENFKI